jgi:hypothetical protein
MAATKSFSSVPHPSLSAFICVEMLFFMLYSLPLRKIPENGIEMKKVEK